MARTFTATGGEGSKRKRQRQLRDAQKEIADIYIMCPCVTTYDYVS